MQMPCDFIGQIHWAGDRAKTPLTAPGQIKARETDHHAVWMCRALPALVAIKHNPDLKTKYEALRGAAKPAKVAIVALMRKLIETANALVKADRRWTQKTA